MAKSPGRRPAERRPRRPPAGDGRRSLTAIRARLEKERAAAIERLRRLDISGEHEELSPTGGGTMFEEGDAAQASERRDMRLASRELVARRIAQLIAALERIDRGHYGRCEVCGGEIEAQRLAALPEAMTCLACQERRESASTPAA